MVYPHQLADLFFCLGSQLLLLVQKPSILYIFLIMQLIFTVLNTIIIVNLNFDYEVDKVKRFEILLGIGVVFCHKPWFKY